MDFWNALLNFGLSVLVGELLRSRQKYDKPKAPGLDEFTFPTATENRAVSVPFGTPEIKAPNTLWWGDYVAEDVTRREKTGIFTHTTYHSHYKFHVGMELALCISGGVRLKKVKADKKVVFTGDVSHGQTFQASGYWKEGDIDSGVSATCEFYSPKGRAQAVRSSYMGGKVSTNPGYQHLTRVVWRGHSAGKSGFVGISQSMKPLSFVVYRMPDVVPLGVPQAEFDAYADINGAANLAYCILETLVNEEWGAGYPVGLINLDDVRQAAAIWHPEGNGVSLVWDSARPVESILEEFLKQGNAILVEDPRTGLLRLRLARKNQPVDIVIDDSNLARIESFTRAAGEEATNEIRLPFKDREGDYLDRAAIAQDLGGIRQMGQIVSATVQYPGVDNRILASKLVDRDLQAAVTPLAKASIKANFPLGVTILPGDLADVTLADIGIAHMPMRVLKVAYAGDRSPEVSLDLVQDVFTTGLALYAASIPPLTSTTPTLEVPGAAAWKMLLPTTPYGLTMDDEADHAMFFAGAPTTGYQGIGGYKLAWWADKDFGPRTEANAVWQGSDLIQFASRCTLAAALPRNSMSSFTVAVPPQDVELVRRGQGSPVLVYMERDGQQEFMRATVTLGSNGTSATVAPSGRGLWDTKPLAQAGGAFVHILYGWVFDIAALPVDETNHLTVSQHARTQSYGPGGIEPLDLPATKSASDAKLQQGWWLTGDQAQRSARPYSAADVRLGGAPVDPEAWPTVNAANLVLTWKPRNRAANGDSAYSAGDAGWEAGVQVSAWIGAYVPGEGSAYASAQTDSPTQFALALTSSTPVQPGHTIIAEVSVTKNGLTSTVRGTFTAA